MVRVIEGTSMYKLKNLRFREFAREQHRPVMADINTEEKCFGYARHFHKHDGDSVEWRPAFISKAENAHGRDGRGDSQMYKVEWVFKPATEKNGEKLMDKRTVVLAHRCPRFGESVDPRHKEFLERAQALRTNGKSDWEIEVLLNKGLEDKFAADQQAGRIEGGEGATSAPPRITTDIIRNYLMLRAHDASKNDD